MKLLGLLRHAKSDWDDPNLRDFDRGLNSRGQQGARLIGRHIAQHGIVWNKIIASPAERVRCTLALAGIPFAGMPPVHFSDAVYMADASTLIQVLRTHGASANAVLLAGHNPGLQELAMELVAPEAENALFDQIIAKFPTAAFAVLELAIDDWCHLSPGCARLVHLARPRDLDPRLGPQAKGLSG